MMNNITGFEQKVIRFLKKIPRGKVTTYGLLARALGRPKAARVVGGAVGRNPYAPIVPCHRVVRSDGGLGGYSGPGGVSTKRRLLNEEGIKIARGRIENFKKVLYTFGRKQNYR